MDLPLLDLPGDYIDGQFTNPTPRDGELVIACPGHWPDRVSTHAFALSAVDAAVAAARRAATAWRRTPEQTRADLLRRYQARLRANRDALAAAIALEVGKPLWEANTEVDAIIGKVDICLGEGARFTETVHVPDLPGEIRYRPLGVVAVIGPFNFPGHLPNGQIVPALQLGNTVVHKPSEKTPSAATWLARCFDEAGFPPGVFNLVQGQGASGQRLSTHPDVDGVLFTGSASVGRRIIQDNAAQPERLIALELGGKNAAIALDDCDVEGAARAIAFAAFATCGQRCTSTSRLIVSPGIAERLSARIAELARGLRIGHPFDPSVFMGPLISAESRSHLLTAQDAADRSGLEVLVAGGAVEVPGRQGSYVRPSVRRQSAALAHVPGYTDQELFAPDLCITVAADLDAAIALANDSRYGLAASVFTKDRAAFEHAAEELRVGVVHWNRSSAGASGRLAFSGIKQSGNYRPAGVLTGETCAYPKSVLLQPPSQAYPSWPGFTA